MTPSKLASVPRKGGAGLTNSFTLLLSSAILLSLAMSSWGVLLPVYLRRIGLSVQQIGALISGVAFVGLFTSLPLGSITDKLGRKNGLIVSLFLYIFLQVLLGVLRNIWGVAFAIILSVFANQLHEITENALVADTTSSHLRGERYIRLDVGAGLMVVVGPFMGGIIADTLGYPALFFIAAFITLLSVVAVLPITEGTPTESSVLIEEEKNVSLREALKRSWQVRDARLFIIALIIASIAASLSNYIFPLYAQEFLRIPVSQIGFLFSLALVPGSIVILLGARLVDRFGRCRPLGWAWLGGGSILVTGLLTINLLFSLSIYAFRYQMLLFLLTMMAFNLVMSISAPTSKAIMMDIAPTQHRAAYQGALMMIAGLSTIPAPLLGGVMYNFSSIAPFVASGTLYILAAMLMLSTKGGKGHEHNNLDKREACSG